MANTYNLEILKLEVKLLEDTLENVVFQADWRYTATSENEEYTEESVGLASIPAPDPDNFTPFDDLTEEQVKSWVESEVNFEKYREYLDARIQEKINPPTEAKDVPW
jgi:hypothetical protein